MSLIKCPECGKEISDRAGACIHCGYPLDDLKTQGLFKHSSENAIEEVQEACAEQPSTCEAASVFDYDIAQGKTQQERIKFYQKTWFVVLMLVLFFPVGAFLMWKYKKFNKVGRVIISALLGIHFLFWSVMIVALLTPCKHEWEPATNSKPRTCWICGETDGEPLESTDTSFEEDDKNVLPDSEIEKAAVQVLYSQLVAYEKKYHNIDAESCKYSINKIERDDGSVEVYGIVYFYDEHGSVVKFGYDYQRNFTVHMTEWGTTPWCEIK